MDRAGPQMPILSVSRGKTGEKRAYLWPRTRQVSKAPGAMEGGAKSQGLIKVWMKLLIHPATNTPPPRRLEGSLVRHWARRALGSGLRATRRGAAEKRRVRCSVEKGRTWWKSSHWVAGAPAIFMHPLCPQGIRRQTPHWPCPCPSQARDLKEPSLKKPNGPREQTSWCWHEGPPSKRWVCYLMAQREPHKLRSSGSPQSFQSEFST